MMNSPADTGVLNFWGLGISFHMTTRVLDHEDPSRQTKTEAKYISSSDPCKLTPWHLKGNDPIYLLVLDCKPHESVNSLVAVGIKASMERAAANKGVKLEIKVEGENIVAPHGLDDENHSRNLTEEQQQPYFFLSNSGSRTGVEWVHGIAVKKQPWLVRQFVARNGGTGASLQHQATGNIDPHKMGVIQIEARLASCPPMPQRTQYYGIPDEHKAQPSRYSGGGGSIFKRHSIALTSLRPGRSRPGKTRESSPSPTSLATDKELEIVPGGLIPQPLPRDPGGIDWDSEPKTIFTVRVVNFEQFRSMKGGEPPVPPKPPLDTRMSHRGKRNSDGTDSCIISNATYAEEHPPALKEEGDAPDTSSGGTETPSTTSTRNPFKMAPKKMFKAAGATVGTAFNTFGTDARNMGKKVETGCQTAFEMGKQRVNKRA